MKLIINAIINIIITIALIENFTTFNHFLSNVYGYQIYFFLLYCSS